MAHCSLLDGLALGSWGSPNLCQLNTVAPDRILYCGVVSSFFIIDFVPPPPWPRVSKVLRGWTLKVLSMFTWGGRQLQYQRNIQSDVCFALCLYHKTVSVYVYAVIAIIKVHLGFYKGLCEGRYSHSFNSFPGVTFLISLFECFCIVDIYSGVIINKYIFCCMQNVYLLHYTYAVEDLLSFGMVPMHWTSGCENNHVDFTFKMSP